MGLKITYSNTKANDHANPVERPEENHALNSKDQKTNDFRQYFSGIYQSNFQSLFNYGMNVSQDKDLVKDCIQELFAELWKDRKTILKVESVTPYLFKCLRRKIKRELGKIKNSPYETSFQCELSHEFKLISQQIDMERKYLLNRAYEKLTERQREAIFLRFYNKFTYEEVAVILKISVKATYKLVARALSIMKKSMDSTQ